MPTPPSPSKTPPVGPGPMLEPVVVEVPIHAPVALVWSALRDPAEIRRWHGWEYPGLDEEIEIIYGRGATVSDADLTLDTGEAGRFVLVPGAGATVVRIHRPAPAGSANWDGTLDEINEGWLAFVQQLRFYIERHHGRARRSARLPRVAPLPRGELYFEAAQQIGIVLQDNALLIASPQHLILSAYGMAEREFVSLRDGLAAAPGA
jgi:hypothetical protein